jgi:site-specific DNA-methyltransferase (adenine-specific)
LNATTFKARRFLFERTGNMLELNKLYNMDCMKGLKEIPDKFFDLAVVDPPYGGAGKDVNETFNGAISGRFGGWFEKYIKADRTGGTWAKKYTKTINNWDIAPPKEYFNELARVSKNQIIWGGNYFDLPPTRCFLIWRKLTISENFSMAMCEYAWTSFNDNAKVFEFAPQGNKEIRFHPTQKPIELYYWILNRYSKEGDKILDTHAGSASSLIACHDMHRDFMGFEIDKTYYEKAIIRMEKHFSQTTLF